MKNKEENSRRNFLKKAAKGAVVAAVAPTALKAEVPTIMPASAKGANDRIRVAVLGVNGRGKSHIQEIMGLSDKANVEVVTLCDPDMVILKERAADFE
ncbi:MAG TPA: twin-arginine translocation signal domain-containing protein, partial [Draconibacterium sp.]|nr:twin-arginine translocation signal domain-containing protein [Draconibacterium sp.]